jgi:hypothetical protein
LGVRGIGSGWAVEGENQLRRNGGSRHHSRLIGDVPGCKFRPTIRRRTAKSGSGPFFGQPATNPRKEHRPKTWT